MNRTSFFSIIMALLILATGLSAYAQSGLSIKAIDTGASASIPMGAYRQLSTFNGGIDGRLMIGVTEDLPIFALTELQMLGNATTTEGTSIIDIAASIGAGAQFELAEALKLGGFISYGFMPHIASGDWGNGITGTNLYSDQIVSAGVEMEYAFNSSSAIYLRPRYTLFIEETTTGHLLGLQAGYRFLLGEN